jgi:hypothetical protein
MGVIILLIPAFERLLVIPLAVNGGAKTISRSSARHNTHARKRDGGRCRTERRRYRWYDRNLTQLDQRTAIQKGERMTMADRLRRLMLALTLVLTAALFTAVTPGYPQTAGQERRDDRKDARDTKQAGRDQAREKKAECKAGDEKTRA